jgi:hypothetical protein
LTEWLPKESVEKLVAFVNHPSVQPKMHQSASRLASLPVQADGSWLRKVKYVKSRFEQDVKILIGRDYPKGPSLCTTPGAIRRYLCTLNFVDHDTGRLFQVEVYADIDMENAHPVLMLQYRKASL